MLSHAHIQTHAHTHSHKTKHMLAHTHTHAEKETCLHTQSHIHIGKETHNTPHRKRLGLCYFLTWDQVNISSVTYIQGNSQNHLLPKGTSMTIIMIFYCSEQGSTHNIG